MTLPELFSDVATPGTSAPQQITSLAVAVNTTPSAGTVETWTFAAAPPSALAQAGQYHFVIGNEICVDQTGGAGTSRQVRRGVGGIISTHSVGDSVYHSLVADTLRNLSYALGSPMSFQAVGNNIADDTTPVQNAIDFCQNGGPDVVIDRPFAIAGRLTYDISKPLRIRFLANGLLRFTNDLALAAPTAVSATAQAGTTSFGAQTNYYRVTALNANGEGLSSSEVNVVITAGQQVALAWTNPAGTTSVRVYRGTAAGGEGVYYSLGAVTSYTDTNAATSGSAHPPLNGRVFYIGCTGNYVDGTQHKFDGIRLVGSGGVLNATAGVRPSKTNGIQLGPKAELGGWWFVTGCNKGYDFYGDHQKVHHGASRGNAYGEGFGADPWSAQVGNQEVDTVDLANNAFASISVSPASNPMSIVKHTNCQFGFSPFALYLEAQGPTPTYDAIGAGCVFDACYFESISTSMIYSESLNNNLNGATFRDCPGYWQGTPLAGYTAGWNIYNVGTMTDIKVDNCTFMSNPGSVGVVSCQYAYRVTWERAQAVLDNLEATTKPILQALVSEGFTLYGRGGAKYLVAFVDGSTLRGDVMQAKPSPSSLSGSGPYFTRYVAAPIGAQAPIVGVAAQAVPTLSPPFTSFVPVCVDGRHLDGVRNVAATTQGQFLVPDPANSGAAMSTPTPFGAGQILGVALTTAGANSRTDLFVKYGAGSISATVLLDSYYDSAIYVNKSAAINAARAAAVASKAVLEMQAHRVYSLDAGTLQINPGEPITIRANGATLQANWGKPRCIDFTRINPSTGLAADYQTLTDIKIEGTLKCDANHLTSTVNQSVVGNLIDGGWGQRINATRIDLDLEIINVPVGNGAPNYYECFSLCSQHLASGETQTSLTNIKVKVRARGGDYGVTVQGVSSTGGVTNVEVYHDQLDLDVDHDTGVVPTSASLSGANVQVGGLGWGDYCKINLRNCANSPDVGLESDGMATTEATGTVIDSRNAKYFFRNFHAPRSVALQKATVNKGIAITRNLDKGVLAGSLHKDYAVGGDATTTYAFGELVLDNCKSQIETPLATAVTSAVGLCVDVTNVYCRKLTVRNFNAGCSALATNPLSGSTYIFGNFLSADPNGIVDVDGFTVALAGTITNISSFYEGFRASATSGLIARSNLRGVTIDTAGITSTTLSNVSFYTTHWGAVSGGFMAGSVREAKAANGSVSAFFALVRLNTNFSTTAGSKVVAHDCDGNRISTGSGADYSSGGGSPHGKFVIRSIAGRRNAAPAASPFQAAVAITPGASPYAYQNQDFIPEDVLVTGGTVSDISRSVDGTNWFTTGQTAGSFRVEPGFYVRVTYTVAPTIEKLPAI